MTRKLLRVTVHAYVPTDADWQPHECWLAPESISSVSEIKVKGGCWVTQKNGREWHVTSHSAAELAAAIEET